MQKSNHFWLGIDVAKHNHQAVVMDINGQKLGESFSFANTQSGFSELWAELNTRCLVDVGQRNIAVGMESTGNYWQHLARFLENHDCQIVLTNPIETQEVARKSIRKVKNDRVDAARIIEVVKTKNHPVWVTDKKQLRLRKLTRFAFRLKRQKSFLEEQILNVIDSICPELQSFFPQFFVNKTSIAILEKWPDMRRLDQVRDKTFTEFLRKKSHGHIKMDQADQILRAIKTSIAKDNRDELSALELQMSLKQLRQLERQIEIVENKAIALAREHADFENINSIPGISEFIAAVALAEIGDIDKFNQPEQLTAFTGLDPSVKESGSYKRKQGNHISKRGSKYLRREMYFAAKAAIMFDSELKAWYQKKKQEGKHYNVIICAVARKMIARIFAVWKEHRKYQPKKEIEKG
jgi:transposase